MSVHLGQCGRCYYGDMQGEIKREDGVREGFLEEKTLKLRFEGGGGKCQPEKEGLARILGGGLNIGRHIRIWRCQVTCLITSVLIGK